MALKNQAIASVKNFLENSLESMADGLFAIDLENKISLFNSAAAALFGIPAVEAIGGKIHRIFPPEFSKFLDHLLEMTNTTGKFEGEFRYQHPVTKKEFPLSVLLSLLKNTQTEQIGIIALCRDMSEHQELIHLRRLDQLKDEFISSVSHELRTPLTAIKSFTEILLNYDEQNRETQKEFLGIIEKETNRLIELINDLLDLSRMNREDFELEVAAVDIKQIFAASLNSVKILAMTKNITIISNLDENQNLVWGDFNRLVQVFINLIGNGIKFSPPDSQIEIASKLIKGKRLEDRGDYLLVSVKDHGIGIPPEFNKAIFERFKQVVQDVSTKPEGSGLGLSICKKIIEKLDGNIWVESKEQKGSTFFFTLPLASSTNQVKE